MRPGRTRRGSEEIGRSAQQKSSLKFGRRANIPVTRASLGNLPRRHSINAIQPRSRQWNRVANARWPQEDCFCPMRDCEKKYLRGLCRPMRPSSYGSPAVICDGPAPTWGEVTEFPAPGEFARDPSALGRGRMTRRVRFTLRRRHCDRHATSLVVGQRRKIGDRGLAGGSRRCDEAI